MRPHNHDSVRLRIVGALVAAFAVLAATGTAHAEAVARQVSGLVEVGLGEPPTWRPVAEGDRIATHATVRTGADGRVELTLAAGTLRVHENSVLRLPPSGADADRVDLESGHSLFDVLRRGGRRFEVHTPTVVVSVKGTRFSVDTRDETGEVAVFHGTVGVRDAMLDDAVETLVREGFVAAVGAGSGIELGVAPPGDPWMRWADFEHRVEPTRAAPARRDEVGRARETMQKATDGAVLERAAKRRPEVAERLQELRGDDDDGRRPGARQDRSRPAPAAPFFEGENRRRLDIDPSKGDVSPPDVLDDARHEGRRELIEQMQAERSLGGPRLNFAYGQLNREFGTGYVPTVVAAVKEADAYLNGLGGSYDVQDVLDQLELELIADGLDATLADDIANLLAGQLGN